MPFWIAISYFCIKMVGHVWFVIKFCCDLNRGVHFWFYGGVVLEMLMVSNEMARHESTELNCKRGCSVFHMRIQGSAQA